MARATASANHDRVREVKAFWGQGKTPEAGPTPTAVLVRKGGWRQSGAEGVLFLLWHLPFQEG